MKYITDIEAGGDKTAAYLFWDEEKDIAKLLFVNNKKASAAIKVECLKQVLKEIELGSYETFGLFVEDWMKDEVIWFTVTYHGNDTGYAGYKWRLREKYYY